MCGTYLFHKIGGRYTIAIGTVLYSVGFCGSAAVTNMYGFLLLFYFTLGFGPALIVLPGTFLSWLCLPARKGLATGVTWLGFGFGGMAYGLIFTFLVNPGNAAPDLTVYAGNQTENLFGERIASKVPMALVATGVGILVICLGACTLVMEAKEEPVRKMLSGSIAAKELGEETDKECPSLKAAFQTSSIYLLFLYSWLSFEFPMIFLYQYKNYGQEYSTDDHLLSATGTVGLFGNSLARLFVSWLADYVPFRPLMICVMLCALALACTVQFIVCYPYVYALWVCLIFFVHGGLYSPTALVCGAIYGPSMGSKVFSIVSQGVNLSNLSMIPVGLLLIEVRGRQPYGYDTAFFSVGLCSGLAALVVVALKTEYDWGGGGLRKGLTDTHK